MSVVSFTRRFIDWPTRLLRGNLRRRLLWACAAAILATTVTLTAVNLIPDRRNLQHLLDHQFAVEDPQFLRTMNAVFGPPLLEGQRIDTLVNGDRIFPAMLDAIRGAKRTINFETYIYWSGEIAEEFANALASRARAGVTVRVVLDWVGSIPMDHDLIETMRTAGVDVRRFHRPSWYSLDRMNNRTHRKLLIVDGRIGFTGGVGIADKWAGDARNPDEWRDTHYRIEGPAVAQMQAAFGATWLDATGEFLHGDASFPPLKPIGDKLAQMVKSSPTNGSHNMHLIFMLALSSAERSIRIASSYFVPDDLTIEQLLLARQRGVDVEIIVPGHYIDTVSVRKASRWHWGDLLAAGVEIYEYQPTMYHCKTLIVDDVWTSIGSANFDERSFRLNNEANLNVFDREFAREQVAIFEEDKRRSRKVSLAEWQNRPLLTKLNDWAWSLLRAQL